jgi:hypothetical protein
MKRRFLFSAVLIGALASSAYATEGILKYESATDLNVSKEWVIKNKLTNSDSNITLSTTDIKYIPRGIPAGSLDNPTLNIEFNNVKAIDVNESTNLGLCELGEDKNLSVLKFDHVDTANNKIIFKAINADNTMGNSKTYFICDTETNDTSGNFGFIVKIDPDSTSKPGIQFKLYSGDSQEVNDYTNTVYTGNQVAQLCAKVTTKADATIDPSTNFVAFGAVTSTTGCTDTTQTDKSDNIAITFYDNKSKIGNKDYEVGNYAILANVKASNELPIDIDNTSYTVSNGTKQDLKIVDNKEFDMAATGINYTANINTDDTTTMTLILSVDGKTPLKTTTFTADLGFNLLNNVDDFTSGFSSEEDAGKWSYKGTQVFIPYVVSNKDTTTVIRFTNGQDINATVYWSCTDDNGVSVMNFTVPSVTAENGEDFVPANGAAAWLARDILAKAKELNNDFAPDGKMKCTPLVTSTSGVDALVIMQINGGRDRVIPTQILP